MQFFSCVKITVGVNMVEDFVRWVERERVRKRESEREGDERGESNADHILWREKSENMV